jgi:hypothetical protein
MLRNAMIVLVIAAALTVGLTVDVLARGGGGGDGRGGAPMGGFAGGAHMRGFAGGVQMRRQNTMNDDLKFQLRLTLTDEFAQLARNDPEDPSIAPLADILKRHDAVMKCQFDAFADYVSEAEAHGIENYPLYEWTKKTVDDSAKKAKYTKSFALYVQGEEVYKKDKADALEAELKPLVGGPIVAKMFKYDTDPARNPQPPQRG